MDPAVTSPESSALSLTLARSVTRFSYDSTGCTMHVSGAVEAHVVPTLIVSDYCNPPEWDNAVFVYADLVNGALPYTVTWNDGTTTTGGAPQERIVYPAHTMTYSVVAAHDAFCSPVLPTPPPGVTVYASPIPDFALGVGNLCTGVTASASLTTPPPAGATVQWFVGNGSVLSGQGTSSIQYQAGAIGTMTVGCIFNYGSDRCPTSHRQEVEINGDPVGTMSVGSPQIHPGGTSLITFTVDQAVSSWTLTDSLNDTITQQGLCGAHMVCQALYTSSHGPGLSTVTLKMTGWCNNTKTVFGQVAVAP